MTNVDTLNLNAAPDFTLAEQGRLARNDGLVPPNWRDLAGVLMKEWETHTVGSIVADIEARFNHLPKEDVLAAISLAREELDRREDELLQSSRALFLAGVKVQSELDNVHPSGGGWNWPDDADELTDLTLTELEACASDAEAKVASAWNDILSLPLGPRQTAAKLTWEMYRDALEFEITPLLEACRDRGQEPGYFVGYQRLGR